MSKVVPPHSTTFPATDGARRAPVVKGAKGDHGKETRVKAALKANIARRKAQAKVRNKSEAGDE